MTKRMQMLAFGGVILAVKAKKELHKRKQNIRRRIVVCNKMR